LIVIAAFERSSRVMRIAQRRWQVLPNSALKPQEDGSFHQKKLQ